MGIILFGLLPTQILGLIIGVSVLTLSVIFLLNLNFRTKKEGLLFTALGLISGSMGVLTGINGPPIVFGLVNQQYDATFIRRCLITYLIVIDIVTLASFSISGYVTVDLLLLLVYSIPFLLIAYVVGKYILTFTHSEKLKRIILFTTLFAGVIAILNFLPWW